MQPKLVLLETLQKGLYFQFAVVLIAFFIHWTIFLRLGFILGEFNIKTRRLLIYSLVITIFSLTKPFLNDMLFMIVYNSIFILVLLFESRFKFLKSLAIVIVIMFLSGFGISIIAEPLICINNRVAAFFFGNPYGIAIGTVIEFIFPLFFLLLSKKINFATFFIKDKYTRSEVSYLAMFLMLCLTLYYTSTDFIFFFTEFGKSAKDLVKQRLIMGWIMIGATFLALIWVRSSDAKRNKVLEDFLAELELTNAKKEVLRLKLDGKKLEEIAQIRGVALTTVKTQINEIKKELNIKDFKEVVDKIKK